MEKALETVQFEYHDTVMSEWNKIVLNPEMECVFLRPHSIYTPSSDRNRDRHKYLMPLFLSSPLCRACWNAGYWVNFHFCFINHHWNYNIFCFFL